MRTIVIALSSLTIILGLAVLALTYFSDESQVTRQFKNQYPYYSIDHVDQDGNESGAYYIVWYKDPKSDVLETAFCRKTGNLTSICNLTGP